MVAVDQMDSVDLTDEDIFIVLFLNALTEPNNRTVKNAISAGQPIYMIHALPKKWNHPDQRRPLVSWQSNQIWAMISIWRWAVRIRTIISRLNI